MQTGVMYTRKGINSYGVGSLGTNGPIHGWMDSLSPGAVAGWAADWTNEDVPVVVDLYIDGTHITSATANQSRPDLITNAGLKSGNHGWNFSIPNQYLDGKSHSFSVKVGGMDLDGSPSNGVTILVANPTTVLPGVMNQIPAGSPGTPDIIFGLSPTTALLIGGGALLLVMTMRGK